MRAQMPHQGPRINLRQHWNGIPLHILVRDLFRAPVRADGREFTYDQALDVGLGRLVVCLVGSVIADLRIGKNDDLTGIGGISGDFWMAG